MKYKTKRDVGIWIGCGVLILLLIIVSIIMGKPSNKEGLLVEKEFYSDTQGKSHILKTDEDVLNALKNPERTFYSFDEGIQRSDFNKQIITPKSAMEEGAFTELEDGSLESNVNTYYVNIQIHQNKEKGYETRVLSQINVVIDGKVNEISEYKDDFNNSQYTFKTKDSERVMWDIIFKYPEKLIKELVNKFNNDSTNKKNNVEMSYKLNFGVSKGKEQR